MPFFPECPDARSDCRFIQVSASETTLDSPLEYDRSGAPVGGGMNTVAAQFRCQACGRDWVCSQTELAWARGDQPTWSLKS